MEDQRSKKSTRRSHSDRRGEHRRLKHRRKPNVEVEHDRRNHVDQRVGYQRKENRRSGTERRK